MTEFEGEKTKMRNASTPIADGRCTQRDGGPCRPVNDANNDVDNSASHVGRRVSKKFGLKYYHGTVDKFDSLERLWHVTYDDGDEEELDREELLFAVGKFDSLHNGKKTATATPSKRKTPKRNGQQQKPMRRSPRRPPQLTNDNDKATSKDAAAPKMPANNQPVFLTTRKSPPDPDHVEEPPASSETKDDKKESDPPPSPSAKNGLAAGVESANCPATPKLTDDDDATTAITDPQTDNGTAQEDVGGDECRPPPPEAKETSKKSDLVTPQSANAMFFATPIFVALIAIFIWLCKSMLVVANNEKLLRSTNLLRFQPDKFQGARRTERYFEGWYYKFVSPLNGSNAVSMAVVPGIFYGNSSDSNESHAFVFVTINGERQHYYRFPTSEFSYASPKEEHFIQVGSNRFTHLAADLNLYPRENDDADLTLRGKLTFSNMSPWPVSLAQLGAMGPVGWIPGLECSHAVVSFDHALRGSLTMTTTLSRGGEDGEESEDDSGSTATISFDGGRGYTEKDHGRSFPSLWVWIQTNSFRHNPGTSLFVSVARIPMFGKGFPGFTAAVWHGGELIPFATWSGAKIEDLHVSEEEVYLSMSSGSMSGGGPGHRVEITVDRRDVPDVLLYAPVNFTKMAPFVREALRARVHMRLIDGCGDVIVDDVGEYAGLELHGHVGWLVDNLCGKETAGRMICL